MKTNFTINNERKINKKWFLQTIPRLNLFINCLFNWRKKKRKKRCFFSQMLKQRKRKSITYPYSHVLHYFSYMKIHVHTLADLNKHSHTHTYLYTFTQSLWKSNVTLFVFQCLFSFVFVFFVVCSSIDFKFKTLTPFSLPQNPNDGKDDEHNRIRRQV